MKECDALEIILITYLTNCFQHYFWLAIVMKERLTRFVQWLCTVSCLSLVSERRWRCWFWRWLRWSFRSTLGALSWHSRCWQIKVSPPSRFVVGPSPRRLSVKFRASSRVTVEPPTFVVVWFSTGVKVVVPAGIVAPFGWVWGTSRLSGAAAALWGATGCCVSRCAVRL